MTLRESCELLSDMTRELCAARRECDSWRLVALALMHDAAEMRRELEMTGARSYTHRRRIEDGRDLWRDQMDIRTVEAAAA